MDLTQENLRTYIDAHPDRFQPAGHPDLEPDGYLPSATIENLLVGSKQIPDPEPAPQTPRPVTVAELMAAAPQCLAALSMQDLELIAQRVRSGDNVGVATWNEVLLAKSLISQAEHDAVLAAIQNATDDDPSHPATIDGPSDLFEQFAAHTLPAGLVAQALGRP